MWNGGTLSVKDAVVDCTGGNAAISSGEPAGSDYDNQVGGKLVVENCTIKNSKYGIYLGQGSNASAELKSATFEETESDIYLTSGKQITISDTFTTPATIKAANPAEGRQLTVAGNANKLNLVGQNESYRVAYDKAQHYYYLTNRAPGYTLTAEDATATIEVEGVVTELTPNDEIDKDTPVTLTANEAPTGQKFADWTVTVDGDVRRDLLTFPNEEDHTTATFAMPKGNVTVKAEYEAIIIDPGTSDSDYGGDIAAGVVIGGIAAVGAYEVGTGLYRITQMDDVAMPTNRLALAKLLWERAGKPEPESTALYSDISAEDTDAQKAARWAVEQELLKDDTNEDEQKFHPAFPVSKLRVCLTWEKAKQKGLFDTAAE